MGRSDSGDDANRRAATSFSSTISRFTKPASRSRRLTAGRIEYFDGGEAIRANYLDLKITARSVTKPIRARVAAAFRRARRKYGHGKPSHQRGDIVVQLKVLCNVDTLTCGQLTFGCPGMLRAGKFTSAVWAY